MNFFEKWTAFHENTLLNYFSKNKSIQHSGGQMKYWTHVRAEKKFLKWWSALFSGFITFSVNIRRNGEKQELSEILLFISFYLYFFPFKGLKIGEILSILKKFFLLHRYGQLQKSEICSFILKWLIVDKFEVCNI